MMNYVLNNREEDEAGYRDRGRCLVEKDDYILVGKIDLLLGNDGRLELLDFKSQKRPSPEIAAWIITKSNSVYMHTYWNSVTAKARPVVALLDGRTHKRGCLDDFSLSARACRGSRTAF